MIKDLKDYEIEDCTNGVEIIYHEKYDAIKNKSYRIHFEFETQKETDELFYYNDFKFLKSEALKDKHFIESVKFNPKYPDSYTLMTNIKNYYCSINNGIVNFIKVIDDHNRIIDIKLAYSNDELRMKTTSNDTNMLCIEKYKDKRKCSSKTFIDGMEIEDTVIKYSKNDMEIEEVSIMNSFHHLNFTTTYKTIYKCNKRFKKMYAVTYQNDVVYSMTRYHHFRDGSYLEISKY